MSATGMGTHWAGRYIGTPWVAGETDCWNFARRVWFERFGLDVPAVPADPSDPRAVRQALTGSSERRAWEEVARPCEGDAVLMARGQRPCHVGIWIWPGGILHSVEAAGVIFTTPDRLAGLGYRILGHYRRRPG